MPSALRAKPPSQWPRISKVSSNEFSNAHSGCKSSLKPRCKRAHRRFPDGCAQLGVQWMDSFGLYQCILASTHHQAVSAKGSRSSTHSYRCRRPFNSFLKVEVPPSHLENLVERRTHNSLASDIHGKGLTGIGGRGLHPGKLRKKRDQFVEEAE